MTVQPSIKPYVPGVVWDSLRECKNLGSLVTSKNYRFVQSYPPGHFYSPIPDIDETRKNPSDAAHLLAVQTPGVDLNEAAQLRTAGAFASTYSEMPFPELPTDNARYYLDNTFYSYGDGIILYSMMRHLQPRRIIEVGAGFSSAAMLDVNNRFFNSDIEFMFIEPYAQRLFRLLEQEDRRRYRVLEKPLQEIPIETFASLERNDILFVDSSHVAKSRSDVLHLLFEVLPRLQSGVVIHFHDVYWPFEYPQRWFDIGRAWNEAYFLRAFLQYNQAFEIVYFNSYMEIFHHDWVKENMPLLLKVPTDEPNNSNSSLWLRRR